MKGRFVWNCMTIVLHGGRYVDPYANVWRGKVCLACPSACCSRWETDSLLGERENEPDYIKIANGPRAACREARTRVSSLSGKRQVLAAAETKREAPSVDCNKERLSPGCDWLPYSDCVHHTGYLPTVNQQGSASCVQLRAVRFALTNNRIQPGEDEAITTYCTFYRVPRRYYPLQPTAAHSSVCHHHPLQIAYSAVSPRRRHNVTAKQRPPDSTLPPLFLFLHPYCIHIKNTTITLSIPDPIFVPIYNFLSFSRIVPFSCALLGSHSALKQISFSLATFFCPVQFPTVAAIFSSVRNFVSTVPQLRRADVVITPPTARRLFFSPCTAIWSRQDHRPRN